MNVIDWTRVLHATMGRMLRNRHDGGRSGLPVRVLLAGSVVGDGILRGAEIDAKAT